MSLIRQALHRGQLTGNDKFIDEVESILGHWVEFLAQDSRPGQGDSR